MKSWNCKFEKIEVKTNKKHIFTQLKPYSACIVGMRNTGKTYFTNYLLTQFGGAMIIFNGTYIKTERFTIDSYDMHENAIKIQGYNSKFCEKIETLQDNQFDKIGYYPPLMVLFDDCMGKNKYDINISNLFTRGRHRNISVIFISQDPSKLNPSWRTNCDYLFYFKTPGRIKFIIDWAGSDLTEKEFYIYLFI